MNKTAAILATLLITLPVFSQEEHRDNLTPKYKEDIEIIKLEEQMEVLQEKLSNLKKEKEKKARANYSRKKVALVLSGGGAKGFAHIGVLRELEKNNIKIDCIVGNSIGAVIGALYSVGYS